MSKIIDYLKKAENRRKGLKSTQTESKPQTIRPNETVIFKAQNTSVIEPAREPNLLRPGTATKGFPKNTWMIVSAIAISLFLLPVAGLGIIAISKKYTQANANTVTRLGRLEELLNKNNQQLTAYSNQFKELGSEIKKLNQQTKESQGLISLMEKNNLAQKTSIDNLTKAKKTLFNKVSELEQRLERLQNVNSATGKNQPPKP